MMRHLNLQPRGHTTSFQLKNPLYKGFLPDISKLSVLRLLRGAEVTSGNLHGSKEGRYQKKRESPAKITAHMVACYFADNHSFLVTA